MIPNMLLSMRIMKMNTLITKKMNIYSKKNIDETN